MLFFLRIKYLAKTLTGGREVRTRKREKEIRPRFADTFRTEKRSERREEMKRSLLSAGFIESFLQQFEVRNFADIKAMHFGGGVKGKRTCARI